MGSTCVTVPGVAQTRLYLFLFLTLLLSSANFIASFYGRTHSNTDPDADALYSLLKTHATGSTSDDGGKWAMGQLSRSGLKQLKQGHTEALHDNHKWMQPTNSSSAETINLSNKPVVNQSSPQLNNQSSFESTNPSSTDASNEIIGEITPDKIFNPESVIEFERQEGVVIATKLHGIHQLFLLEQSLCLLHYAYNKRVNYDIIAFSTDPIDDTLLKPIRKLLAPAKFTLVVDNRGLQEEIEAISPDRREKFLERCGVKEPTNLTWFSYCPGRLAYNWQAEFRAWHVWRHPALGSYRYMLWMDTDGFPTTVWDRDPVAFMIKNQLAIFFDNWPQGRISSVEMQNRIVKSFNKTLCHVSMKDGIMQSSIGGKCQRAQIRLIHGFFHITDLDFYRSDEVMNFEKNWIGDCFLCREYDDQAAVTIPAAMLAPNRSWSMREHGLKLNVFHNHMLDGKDQAMPAGFLSYWKKVAQHTLPEAKGKCPIKAGG
ncbi:hypothetical protein ACA910_014489 [Epithemia clementina (nom. ined.)]